MQEIFNLSGEFAPYVVAAWAVAAVAALWVIAGGYLRLRQARAALARFEAATGMTESDDASRRKDA